MFKVTDEYSTLHVLSSNLLSQGGLARYAVSGCHLDRFVARTVKMVRFSIVY